MPGACPYLTVMVNILTLLAKGDRRGVGGREDRFLEVVEANGKVGKKEKKRKEEMEMIMQTKGDNR